MRSHVLRARIILGCSCGETDAAIAERLGIARQTVAKWRGRYAAEGTHGLLDRPRAGHPRIFDGVETAHLLALLLCRPPNGQPHWTFRELATAIGCSTSTISRRAAANAIGIRPVDRDLLFEDIAEVHAFDSILGVCIDTLRVIVLGSSAAAIRSGPSSARRVRDADPPRRGRFAREGRSTLVSAVEALTERPAASDPEPDSQRRIGQLLRAITTSAPKGVSLRVLFGPRAEHEGVELDGGLSPPGRSVSIGFASSRTTWIALAERWVNYLSHEQERTGKARGALELAAALEAHLGLPEREKRPFVWSSGRR
jgi:transposase